ALGDDHAPAGAAQAGVEPEDPDRPVGNRNVRHSFLSCPKPGYRTMTRFGTAQLSRGSTENPASPGWAESRRTSESMSSGICPRALIWCSCNWPSGLTTWPIWTHFSELSDRRARTAASFGAEPRVQ